MHGYRQFLLTVCILASVSAAFALDEADNQLINEENAEIPAKSAEKKGDFWFGAGAETAMYSQAGFAFGGSFALGYGSGSSIGIKAVWYFTEERIDVVELNFLLRFYFFKDAYNGPFIQLMGGPSLYNRAGDFSIPSNSGMISAGLSAGWRFILFDRWFIEPSIRGGYPYLFGASLSTGIRL